jgi:outer membrane protein OmpA-like peptidoglycan-associated protein
VASLPLRLHANVGAAFDNTGSLVPKGQLVSSEEYALNVNRFSRLTASAALEMPFGGITPFLEYQVGYPLGVPGGKLVSPDGMSAALGAALPQNVGVGAKVTALRQVTFLAGADFGLTSVVGLGLPASPLWNAYLGAAFQLDLMPAAAPPVQEAPPTAPEAPAVSQAPVPAPADTETEEESFTDDASSTPSSEAAAPVAPPAPVAKKAPAPAPKVATPPPAPKEAKVEKAEATAEIPPQSVEKKRRRAGLNVYFAAGKTDIKPRFLVRLAVVVNKMKASSIKRIVLEGHADGVGDGALNERLARERAEIIATYLKEQGIDESRIDIASFGDDKPLKPNTTPKNRLKNRRVEFYVAE